MNNKGNLTKHNAIVQSSPEEFSASQLFNSKICKYVKYFIKLCKSIIGGLYVKKSGKWCKYDYTLLMITQEITQKIKDIVKTYDGKNVFEIAKEKSIKIYEIDFSNLGENISGAILYEKTDNTYTIYLNEKDNTVRKRFTLAHELGHYFLHGETLMEKELIVDKSSVMYKTFGEVSDELEQQANAFAAELLMPEELVKYVRNKLKDIDEMIKIFNVSALAMTYRLTNLKIIN